MKTKGQSTLIGKERSKRNATKHAIFSSVILIDGELRSEFDSLLKGLTKYYRPSGTQEIILVDKLATDYWRLRRMLIAENAEIQATAQFHLREKGHESSSLVNIVVRYEDSSEDGKDLMKRIADPEILSRSLELLQELKTKIEGSGFDSYRDSQILSKLYGNDTTKTGARTLFDSYKTLHLDADCSQAQQQENEGASPEQRKLRFLEQLGAEIKKLEDNRSSIFNRAKLEALRRYVPDSSNPDRLLRYQVCIERSIDRTLAQLERVQRTRLGHPVFPPINVNVS